VDPAQTRFEETMETHQFFRRAAAPYRTNFKHRARRGTSTGERSPISLVEQLESRALFSAAPVITTQPVINIFATQGTSATFKAAATGDPTPTVQWEVSLDGVEPFTPITNNASATTPTLVIPNVQIGQEFNQYEAVFTNSAGTIGTNISTLYVVEAPVVTTEPTSQSLAAAGDTATFTAAATSTTTPSVQWYVESAGSSKFTAVTGNSTATTPTLQVADASAAASGSRYEAIFTNSAGSAATVPATLSVPAVSGTPSTTPTAALTSAKPLKATAKAYYFTVTYSSTAAIDTSSFDKHDVFVTGPSGYEQSAAFISSASTDGGKTVAVTYRVMPVASKWTSLDDGVYHVYVRSNQVEDADGDFVAGGILGPFKVNVV
jgi:hypothetical protein